MRGQRFVRFSAKPLDNSGWHSLCLRHMKILDVPQSGSMAGTTSSRNRNGQYRRSRATPVNPASSAQGTVRARMSANAANWRTLTDAQRAGWADLGSGCSTKDSLGQTSTLTGFQAFCSVNNNKLNAGDVALTDAPAIVTPAALTSATVTTTAGTLAIAYTVTPLPAGAKLFVFASPQRSAGRSFEGDFRLLGVSAAAAASPFNALSIYTAKFGVPVVGNRIFFSLVVYLGGFMSGPLVTSKIVTA